MTRLTVRSGSGHTRTVELAPGRNTLGRDHDCQIVLDDDKASRHHATITQNPDDTLTLEDLGSTNGTHVDGRRITTPTALTPTNTIRIGDTTIQTADTPSQPTTPGTPPTQPASPSRIERLALRRSASRARILAGIAAAGLVVAVALVVLFVTGILGGGDDKLTVPQIVKRAEPSTLQIRRFVTDESENGGSGWVWDAGKGLVVTNAHVVNAAPKFSVRLATESRERSAEIVAVAPCEDLAVLRVKDGAGFTTMPLGSQADLSQGDSVVSIGFPISLAAGDNPTVNTGVVSVVQTRSVPLGYTAALPDVIQTDVAHNPGNSGGPLLDADADLVGVTTFANAESGIQGERYSIGVDRVKTVVPDLANGKSLGWTGIGWLALPTADDLEGLGLPVMDGLPVEFVTPGTPAEEAGLPAPSLIVAIDGKTVTGDVGTYCKAVGKKTKGDSAVFTVIPAGSEDPVDVEVPFA